MKPLLFKIPQAGGESFLVQHDQLPHFYDSLHFHPEFQLTLFIQGHGIQFVGDGISRFGPGELVLIGSGLPHVFRCDKEYYQKDTKLVAESISIYFIRESFGSGFFDLPETQALGRLLQNASRGIRFRAGTKDQLYGQVVQLTQLEGFERMVQFLSLLQGFAVKEVFEFLSSPGFNLTQKEADSEKINIVLDFLLNHFEEQIRLEQLAAMAHMSETSFCRYFKLRTRKTVFELLTEIRIGHACRRLVKQEESITAIAYHCGFNNLSHFNRQFRRIAGYTPSAYRSMNQVHSFAE